MRSRPNFFQLITLAIWTLSRAQAEPNAVVLQSDFGTKDGAVAAMKGVAFRVDRALPIFDLTHEIPPYNIWQASFRLAQTVPFWPRGTVFVSIVDPGVGTDRKPVIAQTSDGQFIVGPDNGQLTFLADRVGFQAMRQIDEKKHLLPGSESSHTFHGRDLFVHVAAKFASGKLTWEEIGPELPAKPVLIPFEKARLQQGVLFGNIPVLDEQYGNVWTNINQATWQPLKPKLGETFQVTIRQNKKVIFEGVLPYVSTFGDVPKGKPLLYLNSLLELSLALNQASFAETHRIGSGPDWSVEIRRHPSKK
jgi:S-adenosylmethionine hydrolase